MACCASDRWKINSLFNLTLVVLLVASGAPANAAQAPNAQAHPPAAELIRGLHSPDPAQHERTVKALAIQPLIAALDDPDKAVRTEAVEKLIGLGRDAPAAWQALVSALANRHGDVPTAIEQKIDQAGPPTIPYFECGLRDSNLKIRGGSAVALSYILAASARVNGPPVGTSQESTVYEWPYWKGVPPTGVIWEVALALSSVERTKLGQTLFNLYVVGSAVKVGLPYVLPWLKDSDIGIRSSALWCLAAMGPAAKPAVADVIQCLSDPVLAVRLKAMEVLGNIGPAAKGAIPQLARTLKDGDSDAAQQAALALAKIDLGYAGVLPVLMKMLEDPQQKLSAIGTLGAMGSRARVALPALEQLATQIVPENPDDTEDHVAERAAAITAIAQIEGTEAIPVLGRVIDDDPDDAVRGTAISALSDMTATKPRAIEALVAAFDNDSQPMREVASAALVKMGPSAIPALIEGLKNPHLYERAWAVETLSRIKPLPDKAALALALALHDKSEIVRNEAADALKGNKVDASAAIRDEHVIGDINLPQAPDDEANGFKIDQSSQNTRRSTKAELVAPIPPDNNHEYPSELKYFVPLAPAHSSPKAAKFFVTVHAAKDGEGKRLATISMSWLLVQPKRALRPTLTSPESSRPKYW